MSALFDLLEEETDPGVRAVLGQRAVRLHPSIPGWKRPDGALSDERDVGVGRLSLDRDPR